MKMNYLPSRATIVALLLLFVGALQAVAKGSAKREFRGAWIQCVNGQFTGMGRDAMQQMLTQQLDRLRQCGVNAIIFQVRPECDALYESRIEPWSRFLTGKQGQAPDRPWDPLAWMVDQCHQRGMELHAWINPFRAKTKGTRELSRDHVAVKHPGWVFPYDGQMILNPALQECRDYICEVVADIVARYDVDGLHIDDYFYPYPAAGQVIPDDDDFRRSNNGIRDKGDWRRDNVNVFMKQLYETIHGVKPWVKFGVSPFGIYRNKRSSAIGSDTNGLQNYDDLYADVLMWVNNGWVDYCVPQLYWQIGHPAADYEKLIRWWDRYASKRNLYIGEDVERTAKYADPANAKQNQLPAKRRLHDEMRHVNGTVLWYAKAAVDNVGNYGTMMEKVYWKRPALMPLMPYIDGKAPKKVSNLSAVYMPDGERVLCWTPPSQDDWKNKAVRFVVYRFDAGEKVNINDGQHIVAVTSTPFYRLPQREQLAGGRRKAVYVITALDRLSNESKPKKISIKY